MHGFSSLRVALRQAPGRWTDACFGALLGLLLAGPAQAEWSKLGSSDADSIYVDYSSLRKNGNIARVLMLRDAATPYQSAQGQPINSRKLLFEFDCSASQYRVKFLSAHSGHMGSGDLVESFGDVDAMQTVPEGTIAAGMLQIACR